MDSSDIATHSYTRVLEVDKVPHLRINLIKLEISVEVTGRGPTAEYIAIVKKTFNHKIVNENSRQKLFLVKYSKVTKEYYFTWKLSISGVKRKHLKPTDSCYFCNYTNPCIINRLVKLKARNWTTVEEKLVKLVNAAKGRNQGVTIHWADWVCGVNTI